MKLIVSIALFGTSTAAAVLYTESVENQHFMWDSFKTEFSKSYSDAVEENNRFQIFVDNLKVIDERNAAEDGSIHGINKFTDMSQDEFRMRYLNYVPREMDNSTYVEIEPLASGTSINKDWTGTLTTPVKDQGYCGSCWAFSATEQIESDYIRQFGSSKILSAQQVTSCSGEGAQGCNGGWTESAFDYAKGGLELNSNYPYTSGTAGVTGSCKATRSLFVVKTTSYHTVSGGKSYGKESESSMATYVGNTGPLSVCVDASNWSSYRSGVMTNCGKQVDHCVQAVGINTAAATPYWKVRNSWGVSWGESGYIRLSYGKDTCAIASDANYATTANY